MSGLQRRKMFAARAVLALSAMLCAAWVIGLCADAVQADEPNKPADTTTAASQTSEKNSDDRDGTKSPPPKNRKEADQTSQAQTEQNEADQTNEKRADPEQAGKKQNSDNRPGENQKKKEEGQEKPKEEAKEAESDKGEAARAEKKISYTGDVRPILQEHCLGCHQPAKTEGGLDLTTVAGMLRGGESEEPAIVPGKADESPLVWQIEPSDGQPPAMPKDADPLSATDVALIRQWIDQGAEDDTPAATATPIDMQHPPQYEFPPVLTAVAYSPDGKLLAVSGYHEVLLYGPEGKKLVARLVGMSERIESLAFSPDGARLGVTGGSPGRLGEVQIWNIGEKPWLELSLPVTHDTVFGGSFSNDGTRFAFGCTDNSLRAIEVPSGKQVLFQGAHNDWVLDTTWSKDDSHLISVSRDRSMKLTEVATQRFVDNITSITPGALKGGLMSVERHPSEDHVLTAGADGQPKLYQIYRTKKRRIGDDFNRLRSYETLPGRAYAVCFNRDGSRFAVCSSADGRGEVRIYQTDDGKRVCTCQGQSGPVYDVAFHPDGTQVASVGFDGYVRINDAETGELLTQFIVVPGKQDDRPSGTTPASQSSDAATGATKTENKTEKK